MSKCHIVWAFIGISFFCRTNQFILVSEKASCIELIAKFASMDQPVSGRNIGGIKQTQISGLLCKYTNVVKGKRNCHAMSSAIWNDNPLFDFDDKMMK